ncbi:hypothetical protein CK203_010197 [Vitis vinifera]|uniref:DUF547 domain-containing protein n=1 Tax=Vitis vinifera TaxID=29760 RepID=A0A438JY43_VITVI|nr:hypothetical protein CK203_010197 [Vitis vinifera]
MKFEDFLMQPRDDQQRRQELEEEASNCLWLNRVLQCALHGPVVYRSCLCSLLPVEVQVLLAELTMVEEEIVWLEGKVQELKLCLYQEKEQNREREAQQQQWRRSQQKQLMCKPGVWIRAQKFKTASRKKHLTNGGHTEEAETGARQTKKCITRTEGSATVPRLTLPCMTSKAFISKASFNSKVPTFSYEVTASNLDPYGILQDLDGSLRKLAFLQHGLPSTQEKLLGLLNKAVLNVGGIVLNALAIEHFILRHPCESKHGPMDEKEILLRHAYGLGYPEPNVTFALCRGSWSSPALRIYTPDDVVNELGRAKLEYLEASVGFTNKKKVMVPKLLQWHMRDFADDMESLLEWIYSQLPCSGSLKRLMMECLNGETKSPTTKNGRNSAL